jgi:hypothetical protein
MQRDKGLVCSNNVLAVIQCSHNRIEYLSLTANQFHYNLDIGVVDNFHHVSSEIDIIGVNFTASGQVPDSRSDDVNFPSGPPGYFLGITFENSQRSASYGPQADQAYIYGIHNVSG